MESEGWLIRPAAPEDLRALTALHLDVWEDAYGDLMPAEVIANRRRDAASRARLWRRALDPGNRERPVTFVAQATAPGHELIGFGCVGAARGQDPPVAREVWGLYVRAAWWGTPVGLHLLRFALGGAPAFLWVLHGNARAIRFYRRQGFEADGTTTADHLGIEQRMVRAGAAVVTDWS